MTLSFRTQIEGKPTHFPEKILRSMAHMPLTQESADFLCSPYCDLEFFKIAPKKIHSIREDKLGRWKQGMKIHFVINNRTKERMQFLPVVMVENVQTIQLNWDDTSYAGNIGVGPYILLPNNRRVSVKVGGRKISLPKLRELAINDGFNSLEAFLKYFDQDFNGKIIHWTKFKY